MITQTKKWTWLIRIKFTLHQLIVWNLLVPMHQLTQHKFTLFIFYIRGTCISSANISRQLGLLRGWLISSRNYRLKKEITFPCQETDRICQFIQIERCMKQFEHSFRQPEYWQLFDFRNPVSDIKEIGSQNVCKNKSVSSPSVNSGDRDRWAETNYNSTDPCTIRSITHWALWVK